MRRTAFFQNASWPGMLQQLDSRGYGGNVAIHRVVVDLDADYGPLEAEPMPWLWVERVLFFALLAYVVITKLRERPRY